MHLRRAGTTWRIGGLLLLLAAVSPAPAVEPGYEVCLDQFPLTPLQRVIYAVDAGGARLDALTAEGYPDAAALVAGTSWDFSGATGGVDVFQFAPVDPAWSCSIGGSCGRFGSADVLMIEDDRGGGRNVMALDRGGSGTVHLRVMSTSDGRADQVLVCFESNVALLRFQRAGECAGAGDANWSTPLDCDRSASLDNPCGRGDPAAGLDGVYRGRVAGAGTLTLPSGHVIDAVLAQAYVSADAKVLLFGACTVTVESMSQYLLFWLVPHYGPLVQLSSPPGSTNLSWPSANSTSIGFGLLPPLSVTVTGTGADTITVSWDPGADTRYVDEWVVHWGEESGHVSAPPFDSVSAGDTIPVGETAYTIRGLTPGTWHISVSARSAYTDPVSGATTNYSSIVLPDTIGADIDGDTLRDTSYPPETSAVLDPAALPDLLREYLLNREPPEPPLRFVLPLDPATDTHIPDFPSGGLETEPVLGDPGMPLVFYALDEDARITLQKTLSYDLRISY